MPLRSHLDPEFVAEPLKSLDDELGPIIMNNPSWYTKAVNDVMFNELDHIRCLYLPQRDSFGPFREVVDYG